MLNKNERLLDTIQKAILDEFTREEKNFEMEAKIMNNKKKVVGYVRSATSDIESQINQISKFAKEQGAVLDEFYIDMKTSGISSNRKQLDIMIDNLGIGDVVIIYKMDRLARNVAEYIKIEKRIEEKGASIKYIINDYPTEEGVHSKLMKNIFLAMTEKFDEEEMKQSIMNSIAETLNKYEEEEKNEQ